MYKERRCYNISTTLLKFHHTCQKFASHSSTACQLLCHRSSPSPSVLSAITVMCRISAQRSASQLSESVGITSIVCHFLSPATAAILEDLSFAQWHSFRFSKINLVALYQTKFMENFKNHRNWHPGDVINKRTSTSYKAIFVPRFPSALPLPQCAAIYFQLMVLMLGQRGED